MKKLYFLLLLLIANFAFSQVTFNPGIRAGANFSHFSKGSDYYNYDFNFNDYYYDNSNNQRNYDFKTRVDFYIGFLGNIRFTRFYALQPEINYSRQGTRVQSNSNNKGDKNFSVSYLGAQLINKFYFKSFNVHVGPTLDFVVDKDFSIENEVDLGITAGVGYDITKNLGVEARVRKGFVPVVYSGDNSTNVVFQAGVYYTFDMK